MIIWRFIPHCFFRDFQRATDTLSLSSASVDSASGAKLHYRRRSPVGGGGRVVLVVVRRWASRH